MDGVMQWECCGAELLCTLAARAVYPSSLPAPHVEIGSLGVPKIPLLPACAAPSFPLSASGFPFSHIVGL